MDYKIRIRGNRAALTLSPRSVCKVLAGGMTGFDAPEREVTLERAAACDGGYPVTRRTGSRDVSVTFEISDAGMTGLYRDLIMKLTDPGEDVEIETFMWERWRRISVIPDGTPEFIFSGHGDPMRVRMDFIACSPFFRDVTAVTATPASPVPLLSFPLSVMPGAGTVTGICPGGRVIKVNNPGDVECGFRMTLFGTGGPVTDPMITCRDFHIRPRGTVTEGEEISVVTEPGKKVIKDGRGRNMEFYTDSTFFGLLPGENVISVSATAGAENISAALEFTPLYFGA